MLERDWQGRVHHRLLLLRPLQQLVVLRRYLYPEAVLLVVDVLEVRLLLEHCQLELLLPLIQPLELELKALLFGNEGDAPVLLQLLLQERKVKLEFLDIRLDENYNYV